MHNDEKEKPKRAPKLKRDETGRLIVTYNSRLLKPKKHDEEWRAKKLAEYEKKRQQDIEQGKGGSMLGYFAPSPSAALGDSFIESSRIQQKLARGKGPQLRSGARQSKVVTGTFGKFTTNAVGDPYMSPGQIRAKWLKEQKKKFIQPPSLKGGATGGKHITKSFSRARFLSTVDGDEDVKSLKEKIKKAKETLASPVKKFDNFKGPGFVTNPVKKGGPGMSGVLLPVYGDDKTLKSLNKYVESPYEARRQAELDRMKAHQDAVAKVHGDNPKAFAGRVSNKGVATFSKDVELYGEDKEVKAMVKAKLEKEAAAKAKAEEAKAGEEPPPQWKPSNPPKKMQYADKRSFFGGSNLEYVADPVPEFQAGAKGKRNEDEDGEPLNPAWVPSGAHSHGHKGTTSVCLNSTQLRHQLFAKAGAATARTARTTTR